MENSEPTTFKGASSSTPSFFSVCTSYMNDNLMPWLQKLPPGEGMGQQVVQVWGTLCKKLEDGQEVPPHVQAQALALVSRACSCRLAQITPGDVDDALLKELSITLRNICQASPPDMSSYAQLRETCVTHHLTYLDLVESLVNVWKSMRSPSTDSAESEAVGADPVTLLDSIDRLRTSWCHFMRRPKVKDLPSAAEATEGWDFTWDSMTESFQKELGAGVDEAGWKRVTGSLSMVWLATLRMSSSYLYDLMQGLGQKTNASLAYDQEGILSLLGKVVTPGSLGLQHAKDRTKLANMLKTLHDDFSRVGPDMRRQSLDGLEEDLQNVIKRITPPGDAGNLLRNLDQDLGPLKIETTNKAMGGTLLGLRAAALALHIWVAIKAQKDAGLQASTGTEGAGIWSVAAQGPPLDKTAAETADVVNIYRPFAQALKGRSWRDIPRALPHGPTPDPAPVPTPDPTPDPTQRPTPGLAPPGGSRSADMRTCVVCKKLIAEFEPSAQSIPRQCKNCAVWYCGAAHANEDYGLHQKICPGLQAGGTHEVDLDAVD